MPVRVENVHAHVIAIGPDAELRIVEKVRAEMKSIAMVRTRRVTGGRNGDAFVGRNLDAGKLA